MGVIARDCLLPSQNPRRHLREPLAPDAMRARRQVLAASLAARYDKLSHKFAPRRRRSKEEGRNERERNSKHVERFASNLEESWNDFQMFAGEFALINW